MGKILDALEADLPGARIALDFGTPLELLIATILSAQCTDKRVNMVTPALFARYRGAADYASASEAELEGYIRTCGLYRSKARNIIAACRRIVAEHGGEIPGTMEELSALPGVGRKTANVVLANAFGQPRLAVDTHVGRVARRLGFTTHGDPDKIELDLYKVIPVERRSATHHLLIWHGRKTCHARIPACGACPVADWCKKSGV
ncbi:MAG: Endonuclease III [Myxococcota bacterium]|nr:Endonuclease III [Myxococcota bacterium]